VTTVAKAASEEDAKESAAAEGAAAVTVEDKAETEDAAKEVADDEAEDAGEEPAPKEAVAAAAEATGEPASEEEDTAAVETTEAKPSAAAAPSVSEGSAAGTADLPAGVAAALALPGNSRPWDDSATEYGYLDPFNMTKTVSPATVRKWRQAEVTHGRLAMGAVIGILVGEAVAGSQYSMLGLSKFASGPAINHIGQITEAQPTFPVWFLVFWAFEETRTRVFKTARGGFQTNGDIEEGAVIGDIGFDPLRLTKNKDADFIADLQTKELNNGRLAMFAAIGMLVQEAVSGETIFEHLGVASQQAGLVN
jgi:hypothetical protein